MNSFIDWLIGYLDDKVSRAELERVIVKYKEIEDKKFTDNVKIPTELNGLNFEKLTKNKPNKLIGQQYSGTTSKTF